ncbi:MarR family winged helix-turn-helix transcriptional regulator [Streptomyces jeddahensis]|uniref:MarR family transcriptional regulator n=1 Tax=Streptomyces jeddahensis TaxID=1716141 RepID=A0A177HQ63_9ACTN|nr:MarR family winged helix-turn-helix transcriptional regulator [Streptomyces jeddahensis]OAH13033.1 hypothetical protein STSP_36800 [Streptomyces jeddahensis]
MEFTDAELLTQPMGYWTGAANQAIVGHINASLHQLGIAQRHWWSLYRVSESEHGLTREDVAKKIVEVRPYVDASVVGSAIDDLLERGWLEADFDGRLTLTGAGSTALVQIRDDVIPGALARVREGVSDEEFVLTIKVLRRMIGNVGGNTDFVP